MRQPAGKVEKRLQLQPGCSRAPDAGQSGSYSEFTFEWREHKSEKQPFSTTKERPL